MTTPVGFFNGMLQRKADLGWPGEQDTYQTENGANGYGLYDMAGNVRQWCTEWYERNYYAYSPAENPPGPAQGSPMPDGKVYRCMRGGSWFNGEFPRACRQLMIKGITLHSYRYAWAERAKTPAATPKDSPRGLWGTTARPSIAPAREKLRP